MDLNISEERFDEIVNDVVYNYVRNTVSAYGIERKIDEAIMKSVEGALEEKFKATVRAIVDEFLTGPVDINDGWGSRTHYNSYSDFFAAKLREHIDSSYPIRSELHKALEKKVNEAWNVFKDEAIKEVLARHVEEG